MYRLVLCSTIMLLCISNVWAEKIEFSYNKRGELLTSTTSEYDDKTFYLYDSLGNLLSINNGGNSSESSGTISLTSPKINSTISTSKVTFKWVPSSSININYYDLYLGVEQLIKYKSGLNSSQVTLELNKLNVELSSKLIWKVVGYSTSGKIATSDIGSFSLSDKDGDGVFDFQEYACMDGNNRDSDNDGVDDGTEINLKLNPCSSDTDGDGIPDGIELSIGSSPLKVDTYSPITGENSTAWEKYVEVTKQQLDKQNIPIDSLERVLNVNDVDGFLQTGIHPDGENSLSVLVWIQFDGDESSNQTLGTDDDSLHRFYIGRSSNKTLYAGVGASEVQNLSFDKDEKHWAHLALTYNAKNKRFHFYVNGKLLATKSDVKFYGNSKRALLFGAINSVSEIKNFMNAKLDDIQIWDRSLTQNEVLSYLVTPPIPGENDLTAYYNFERTRGSWVENISTGEFDAKLSSLDILSPVDKNVDSDEDGLTDREELALGTDVQNADTDGDGLSDGVEMGVETGGYLSSPLLTDSDQDGIPDGVEYETGSDLLTADANAITDGQTNWQRYVAAEADAASDVAIESVDGVLDVADNSGYLQTGIHPNGSQAMTMMMWVKLDAVTQAWQASGVREDQSRRFHLGIDYQNDLYSGVGTSSDAYTDSPMQSGRWAHLALSYDPTGHGRYDVYVNGNHYLSDTYVSFEGESQWALLFGSMNNSGEIEKTMGGQLDEVQVWSQALTQEEIKSYMLTTPEPGATDLIAYYNFSHRRGNWVENVATGQYDARLTSGARVSQAEELADSDGDGLTDRDELALGTDADKADTDGDGLSDGVEMGVESGVYLSSPLLTDTDRDGIPDGFEYEVGSDLLTADANAITEGQTNWQRYVAAEADAASDVAIESVDGVLDVADNSGYLQTGIHPNGSQAMTMMMWVKLDAVTQVWQASGVREDQSRRFHLGVDYQNDLYSGVGTSSNAYTDSPMQSGRWAHLALSYDPTGRGRYDVYVNGNHYLSDTYVSFEGESQWALLFGAMNNSGEIEKTMGGQLDEVLVWSRALTQEEIKSYMLTTPELGATDLIAYYNFSHRRGDWVENVATGQYDARLTNGARVSQAEALADSDGDGLTDRDELALGTDADKADTDGDGLSDGVEMGVESGVYLSSPLLTDTDRDGIPDGFEYEVGSDLLTPDAGNDADGDGKTNWQDYVVAVADESSEQAIEDINGVLDVANNNGYLQTGIHPNGNQPMTVMMWVKLNSVELSQRSGVLDHSGRRFYFGINEQNNAYIGMGKKYSSEYRASLKSGEWAHFAISYDPTGSGRYQIYINGHAHSYGTSLAFDGQSKWAILFGALNNEGTIIDPMAGELDDIQVWSKTLTQEEVRGFMVTEPKSGISDLIAHYNFSNRRGDWVENVATGQYDARLTKGAWISAIEASLDSDSDGLTDRKELAFGTDAENWDTDGDGLSDGVEMGVDSGIYLSSPLLTDTDRDGIPDGFEYEVGSDLLVSDATSDESGNGKTNWQEYLESVSELNASEPLVEDDRVLDVTGGTKYLETGIHPKGGESMTFMYWVKYDAIGSAYQLSGTHDGKSHRFYLGLKKAQLTGGVGSDTDYGVSAGLEVGQWAHLALVYNAESARFEMYVNGELNNYETYVRFNGESLYGLLIGALNGAEGIKNIQEAQIDDVQVWSRAFNQSEIQSYMLTPPQRGENDLTAYYNFSRSRGNWIENVATGRFDAKLSGEEILSLGSHE